MDASPSFSRPCAPRKPTLADAPRLGRLRLFRRALWPFLALLLFATPAPAWQTGVDYTLRTPPLARSANHPAPLQAYDSLSSGGAYLPSSIAICEGGFSGLWMDPADPTGHTFLTVTERGPVASWGASGVAHPLPDYHQKIVRLRVQGDSLALVDVDSVATPSGTWTTGLPSSLHPDADTAYATAAGTAVVDRAHPLATDFNGYDFEAISGDGQDRLYLADEYGPTLLALDGATRGIERRYAPGTGLPLVFAHRRRNRGFEAMTVTPAGRIVAMTQSPMTNPLRLKKDSTRAIRVLELDPATGATRQFVYLVDVKRGLRAAGDAKLSDLAALDDTTFLVLEGGETSDGREPVDLVQFTISSGTTDVSLASGLDDSLGCRFAVYGLQRTVEQLAQVRDTALLALAGIQPVLRRTVIADLLASTHWTHPKPEGLAVIDDTTIALLNDNDYGANAQDDDGILHELSAERTRIRLQYVRWRSAGSSATQPRVRKAALPTWTARAVHGGIEIAAHEAGGPWVVSDVQGRVLARVPALAGAGTVRVQFLFKGMTLVRMGARSEIVPPRW